MDIHSVETCRPSKFNGPWATDCKKRDVKSRLSYWADITQRNGDFFLSNGVVLIIRLTGSLDVFEDFKAAKRLDFLFFITVVHK